MISIFILPKSLDLIFLTKPGPGLSATEPYCFFSFPWSCLESTVIESQTDIWKPIPSCWKLLLIWYRCWRWKWWEGYLKKKSNGHWSTFEYIHFLILSFIYISPKLLPYRWNCCKWHGKSIFSLGFLSSTSWLIGCCITYNIGHLSEDHSSHCVQISL